MALYGAMYPVIATTTLSSSAITYSAAKVLSELARAEVTENYANGKYDADNYRVIYKQKFVDADINVEVETLSLDDFKQLFGHTITTTGTSPNTVDELSKSGSDVIPNVGFGFIHNEANKDGTESWIGHFFPWVQATPSAKAYETQGSDSINLAGYGLTLKAYDDPINHNHEYVEVFSTEASAKTWLNAKVNLT